MTNHKHHLNHLKAAFPFCVITALTEMYRLLSISSVKADRSKQISIETLFTDQQSNSQANRSSRFNSFTSLPLFRPLQQFHRQKGCNRLMQDISFPYLQTLSFCCNVAFADLTFAFGSCYRCDENASDGSTISQLKLFLIVEGYSYV